MKTNGQSELFDASGLELEELDRKMLALNLRVAELHSMLKTENQERLIYQLDAISSSASQFRNFLTKSEHLARLNPKPTEEQSGKPQPLHHFQIYFDGGCSPNPGEKYGSYEVVFDDRSIQKAERIAFGYGTNNEAEFDALTAALRFVANYANETELRLNVCAMKIFTDSAIVRNRVGGRNKIHSKPAWKEASARMFEYASRILEFKPLFNSFTIEWRGREHNVERFGH